MPVLSLMMVDDEVEIKSLTTDKVIKAKKEEVPAWVLKAFAVDLSRKVIYCTRTYTLDFGEKLYNWFLYESMGNSGQTHQDLV